MKLEKCYMGFTKALQNKQFILRLTTYNLRLILVFSIGFISFGFSRDANIWNKAGTGIYESDIRSILISPKDQKKIFVGTSKALYRSNDQGQSYQVIFQPPGEQKAVNSIYIPVDQPEMIYAVTDAGLYETQNDGKTWNRIYYSSDMASRQCLSVIRKDNIIYVGTQKGLFRKTDQKTNWHMVKEGIGRKPIYRIVQDNDFIYFAAGQALFGLNKQTYMIKTVFSVGVGGVHNENNVDDQVLTDKKGQSIKFVEVSPGPISFLFTASSKGIYISSTKGKEWSRLPTTNLALEHITSLVVLENDTLNGKNCYEEPLKCFDIVVGTSKGVFFLNNEKWIPLYKGIETNAISYLAKDAMGTVYAATGKGIYSLNYKEALPTFNVSSKTRVDPRVWDEFKHEPTINEVHALAIDYAEVNQDKIENWRILSRKKALLPDLSVGLDRNSSDLFHWNTGASPDELQKGRDYIDWDVSLSWDLADFIWSTDQTTIDSRSKLMVELREDILDEVTRLYFERRRLQIEMVSYDTLEPYIKLDKDLRIAELTALIDALTGGAFSKRIHQ